MAELTNDQRQTLTRWRLVLGKSAEQHGISIDGDDEEARRIEALVGFLFAPPDGGGGEQSTEGSHRRPSAPATR